jgi:hypothetical protein
MNYHSTTMAPAHLYQQPTLVPLLIIGDVVSVTPVAQLLHIMLYW